MTTKDYKLAADRLNKFSAWSRFQRLGNEMGRISAPFKGIGLSVREAAAAIRGLSKLFQKLNV